MTPEAKIWTILNKIDDALSIAPSEDPAYLDAREIEKSIKREEHGQIMEKLARDRKLFEIKQKPDYKKEFNYVLLIADTDEFRNALNDAHIKHFGSIEMLTGDNFFSVVDVSADIMNRLQMTMTNKATIPLLPSIVRFSSLMPMDGINHRDNYCDFRWKAMRYLKDNEHIVDFVLNRDGAFHRWEQTITISVDRTKFTKFYERLMKVYGKRVKFPNKEAENKTAATIPPAPKTSGKNPYQTLIDVIDILLKKIEITPKNRLTGNQIKIHISETSLPQNAIGIEELAQILNTLKQSCVFNHADQPNKVVASGITAPSQNIDQLGALFTITEPNKNLLLKEREKWVAAGGGEGQPPIHKIEIVGGSIKTEVTGLEKGLNAIATASKEEKKNKFPNKLPAGTEWKNFIIQFLNKEEVYIRVNRFKHNENYAKMDFVDNRFSVPKPNEGWTFLWVLSKYNGELTIKDPDAKDTYKKQKELVSKALKSYFSMESDPFYSYQETKSYKTRFTLLPPPEKSEEKDKKHKIPQAEVEQDSVDEEIRQYFEEQAPQVYDERG